MGDMNIRVIMKTMHGLYGVEEQGPTPELTSEEIRFSENFILSWDLYGTGNF
jgi:hypothetical protein